MNSKTWDAGKGVLWGRFLAFNAYIAKKQGWKPKHLYVGLSDALPRTEVLVA